MYHMVKVGVKGLSAFVDKICRGGLLKHKYKHLNKNRPMQREMQHKNLIRNTTTQRLNFRRHFRYVELGLCTMVVCTDYFVPAKASDVLKNCLRIICFNMIFFSLC